MDDREVVRSFVIDGARQAPGSRLHVERDALLADGWWHAAFRISPTTFIVRTDDPPEGCSVLADLAAELSGRGLAPVGEDRPLVAALTYAELSLGSGVGWGLWGPDLATAEADLGARISAESFFDEQAVGAPLDEGPPDLSTELEGARRMFGLPATVLATVGLDSSQVQQLRAALPECRLEAMSLDTAPDACGALSPAAVLVDATTGAGREFVMELRASACGRFLPVAALTVDEEPPLGADVALDASRDPLSWSTALRQLLP